MDQVGDQGNSNQTSLNPRSQSKGVGLYSHNKQHTQYQTSQSLLYTFDTRLSATLPCHLSADFLNNANIEDRWVPDVLWLWAASRIEAVLTLNSSNSLNSSVYDWQPFITPSINIISNIATEADLPPQQQAKTVRAKTLSHHYTSKHTYAEILRHQTTFNRPLIFQHSYPHWNTYVFGAAFESSIHLHTIGLSLLIITPIF